MTVDAQTLALSHYSFDSAEERETFRRDRLNAVAAFLHDHLDRFGDPLDQVRSALNRASGDEPGDGGTVTIAEEAGDIVGVVVTLRTFMSGYAPENLLVYIAAHRERRGRGIGQTVMTRALDAVKGSVALHVEPDNPARKLYEKLGFDHKYLEMRLER